MKLKLLLFLMMLTGMLYAQEPYRNLIISEARMDGQRSIHVELTNMGNQEVNLSEFKFALMRPWIPEPILDVWNDPWVPEGNRMFMLPDRVLSPGESFVLTTAVDFEPKQYYNRVDGFEGGQRPKQIDIYDLADFLIHIAEPKGTRNVDDSVTVSDRYGDNYQWVFETWSGRGCFMIEHHFAEGDSAVIDQVGGVFDNNGRNFSNDGYDVAGVAKATGNSLLVRKFSVKTGNLDFANARGVGEADSEWMPIQRLEGYNNWRDLWWTVGNHGAYVLDENTLESDVIDVDFANKTLTVPWGVRRLDDVMRQMEKKPGIAWNYHLSPSFEDSLYYSARTGDQITIYVLGNTLQTETFDIVVSEPTSDANIVVPKARVNIGSVWNNGPVRTNTQAGIDGIDWPRVTKHTHGTDTITGTWHGLPFAMRTDTLMKYLEKPANATWEFVWVDGVARPDLKNGDKLKVTAQNGSVKEYFIQVRPYGPSHNGFLASITWPDMPNHNKPYYTVLGWKGDTIAGFNATTYNYRMPVPADYSGIPALIAKTQALNAKVEVKKAVSLAGTVQDRTISFTVIAEDDSVTNTYNVELVKEKDPAKLQPYFAEPFLAEYIYWDQWSNSFAEIANPGNQPLDLSNYMIAMNWTTNPADLITWYMAEDDWNNRYVKYVPGYKWVDQTQWAVTPGILVQDLSVNPIIQPGDVFCLGAIATDGQIAPSWMPDYVWPVPAQLDVQFLNYDGNKSYRNPWGEYVNPDGTAIRHWQGASLYMWKILNDSIKLGLKPANDPLDFELIETWSMEDGSDWVVGGLTAQMITNWMRKPDIYQGNTGFGEAGSFGTNPDDSEWTWTNRAYWQARNAGWPLEVLNIGNDLGQHFMYEPTHYKSTVTSVVYKVSEGYSMDEDIRGMTPGTTVGTFLSNLNKANENQTLTVLSGDTELGMDDMLSLNDVLIVLSADSVNTTQYILDVNEEGLSSNAVLTSTLYTIEIESEPKSASATAEDGSGYITGFEYGTQLRTVLNNVTVPAGATLSIVDGEGAYVSLRRLNFDTAYVNVTVNANTYFDVVAENGVTRIVYQLQPRSSANDAFILSDVYAVSQSENLVNYVPRGTNVNAFIGNIIPSFGATVKLVDKMGFERTEGTLYEDDKVVVTSPNGLVTRVYHLSMLRTQYILETTYLAYVLSNIYNVDQVNYQITGVPGNTTVTDFYSRITPSWGATAVVVNANGNEKTSGDINAGDMVKVTSADGKIEVMYQLGVTSAFEVNKNQIEIYPNPTSGKLNVSGVEKGNRIQVYNASGAMVRDMKVQSSLEVLSLDNQPAGMFLIVISKNDQLLGRYKAIKN
ncbi:MAG: T9SS type A sorting domain-containing protein [Mariniphaga sp.]|nr:T9SS type A sorting domain-containing protein [Mariniphaga sp.]